MDATMKTPPVVTAEGWARELGELVGHLDAR